MVLALILSARTTKRPRVTSLDGGVAVVRGWYGKA